MVHVIIARMKLSVIVPVYNVENYIEKCMVSLLNQDFDNFEILLVDDGSLDKSIDIACSLKHENQSKVKVLKKVNGGLSDARNFGIDHAQGEYLAFIDSDDYIDTTMFRRMMDLCETEKSDIVCCDMKYVFDNDEEKYSSAGNFDVSNPLDLLLINNSACNKIYKTSLFQDVRFPKGKWYEDLETIPKVVYNAKKISYINEAFYFYVQRSTSIAHQINPKIFDIYSAIDSLDSYFRGKGIDDEKWETVYQKYIITHGLIATTLRIKESDSFQDKYTYYKRNNLEIRQRVPHWFKAELLRTYSIKQKIIFNLIKYKLNLILAILF